MAKYMIPVLQALVCDYLGMLPLHLRHVDERFRRYPSVTAYNGGAAVCGESSIWVYKMSDTPVWSSSGSRWPCILAVDGSRLYSGRLGPYYSLCHGSNTNFEVPTPVKTVVRDSKFYFAYEDKIETYTSSGVKLSSIFCHMVPSRLMVYQDRILDYTWQEDVFTLRVHDGLWREIKSNLHVKEVFWVELFRDGRLIISCLQDHHVLVIAMIQNLTSPITVQAMASVPDEVSQALRRRCTVSVSLHLTIVEDGIFYYFDPL